jgi:hypothetical protein
MEMCCKYFVNSLQMNFNQIELLLRVVAQGFSIIDFIHYTMSVITPWIEIESNVNRLHKL